MTETKVLTENMKGKTCPFGEHLDRPTPNICQHEAGHCFGCQIYLDFFQKEYCAKCNERDICDKENPKIFGCQAMVNTNLWKIFHTGDKIKL